MPLIAARNLEKVFEENEVRTPALSGITLEINAGEFVAIMGPSGSGKSTFLHILGFLDRPSGGEYRFDGKTIDDYSRDDVARVRNSRMGFVFQAFNLLPKMTVYENVELPLLYSDLPQALWPERIREAISSVGLNQRMHYEAGRLSGGEKQRAAIARALVNRPRVIFADEPTGNLDSQSGGQVMQTLQRLSEEGGHTIVLITHESYAAAYARRVVQLRDGKVESDSPVQARRHDGYAK